MLAAPGRICHYARQARGAIELEKCTMGLGFWQILLIVLLLVLLFGRGKISDLMGDMAKGIKSFKSGLSDEDDDEDKPVIEHKAAEPVSEDSGTKKATTKH